MEPHKQRLSSMSNQRKGKTRWVQTKNRLYIEPLLPRPVGRPSNAPVVWYAGFLYQAKSWNQARRVVAGKRPCKPVEQEENREKGPRGS
jgi:hypothetical protein